MLTKLSVVALFGILLTAGFWATLSDRFSHVTVASRRVYVVLLATMAILVTYISLVWLELIDRWWLWGTPSPPPS